ncbi:toxic anion resistance protein [Clostridium disporicum]|uniref:toxic anion resistance protein n=1 Tax=Clostridium disporicum TaxID=84024 RepID=UPI0034A0F93D
MNDVKTGEVILGGLNLDFEKAGQGVQNQVVPVTTSEVQEFTNKYKQKLREDSEVQALVSKINVTDTRSILEFGHDASESITSISDRLLNSIRSVNQEEAGEILVQLTKIMKKFEIEDFKNMKEPGFFEKMFKKVKNSVESILAKYDSMGADVDRIYMILKKYEADVMSDSQKLSELYKANIQYYQELEKYIVAGELALEELDTKYLPHYEQLALNGEGLDQQNYQTLKICRDMLDQRVYDLKIAEGVALQSLPMIQQMQMGNFDLVRTIKSSFIITLPIFKQCLIQAIILKRQELKAKNIEAVRQTTNELLIKNAQNTSRQAIELARMSGRGAVDLDKLEQSFQTIMQGVSEAKKVQEQNRIEREKGSQKLEELKYKALTQKDVKAVNTNSNQGLLGGNLGL